MDTCIGGEVTTTKSVVATKKVPSDDKLLDELLYSEFKKETNGIMLTDEQRSKLTDLFVAALKMVPEDHVENTKISEDNVVCKMFLKGYPMILGNTVDTVLKSLIVKNKNGYTDYERTSEYVMTLLIEKVKKE